jgi:acid phosphatase
MLNAVLWLQSAAEYEALTRQAYQLAREQLDRAIVDPRWTAALEQEGDFGSLPPAIVLDLDETVWSNARYEARLVRRYGKFSQETFSQWCRESAAPVLPGAREFLDYAHGRGVAIFYYSTRPERLRGCTRENLGAQGLPEAGRADRLLLNDGTGKAEHRRRVSRNFRVLLLVGDALEDFAHGYKGAPAERKRVADRYRDYWGKRWIMLPNPVYGHWEASFYEFDYAMPRAEQLRRKSKGLEP